MAERGRIELARALAITRDAYSDTVEMYLEAEQPAWGDRLAEVAADLETARKALGVGNFADAYDMLYRLCTPRYREVVGDDIYALRDMRDDSLRILEQALKL